MKAMRHDSNSGPLDMCIRLRQNTGGGGGPGFGNAPFGTGPDGTLELPSMFPFEGASWMAVRSYAIGGTCGL
jgi:hypothetical protein